MSDGLIVFSGLRGNGVGPPIAIPAGSSDASLLIGMPSMMYSGSLLALIDVPPRMRICAPAPGSPLFWVIWTPVARPSIRFVTLAGTAVLAWLASIGETEHVMASRRWVPYPVV